MFIPKKKQYSNNILVKKVLCEYAEFDNLITVKRTREKKERRGNKAEGRRKKKKAYGA